MRFPGALPRLKRKDAVVLGVSILDEKSKAKFAEKHGLTFPLLADADHEVAEKYGVWQEKSNYGRKYMGIARTTYLIGPDGKVARALGQREGERPRRRGARHHSRRPGADCAPAHGGKSGPALLEKPRTCLWRRDVAHLRAPSDLVTVARHEVVERRRARRPAESVRPETHSRPGPDTSPPRGRRRS